MRELTGAVAVLLQEDDRGVDHPVRCFSKKISNKHQINYSTIEKETLALLLALQRFEVHVYNYHNSLVFKQKSASFTLAIVATISIEINHLKRV